MEFGDQTQSCICTNPNHKMAKCIKKEIWLCVDFFYQKPDQMKSEEWLPKKSLAGEGFSLIKDKHKEEDQRNKMTKKQRNI